MNIVERQIGAVGLDRDGSYWKALFGEGYAVHAAERSKGGEEVVLWSDEHGYSVTHRGRGGHGTSGTFPSIVQAAEYMAEMLEML